jgi:hypothetical protein
MKKKPVGPQHSQKTAMQALWAAELLVRAYKNGEEGEHVDWSEVDTAHHAALEALKLARKEGYRED